MLWNIISILWAQFLLQHYSCVISTLEGFQDQTGYSPEQPGLASQLTLLREEVEALIRSPLTWIIPQSSDYCFFSVQIRISQGFHLCIGLFLQQNINFTFSASLTSFLKCFPPPVEVTFTSFLSNSSKLYYTFFPNFHCLTGNITAIWQTVCFYFFFPLIPFLKI